MLNAANAINFRFGYRSGDEIDYIDLHYDYDDIAEDIRHNYHHYEDPTKAYQSFGFNSSNRFNYSDRVKFDMIYFDGTDDGWKSIKDGKEVPIFDYETDADKYHKMVRSYYNPKAYDVGTIKEFLESAYFYDSLTYCTIHSTFEGNPNSFQCNALKCHDILEESKDSKFVMFARRDSREGLHIEILPQSIFE